MEDRIVRFCACDANPPLMVENVPAAVCDACGEKQFSDATVEVFERIRDGDVGRTGATLMRLYDFNRAVRGERVYTMHVVVEPEAALFGESNLRIIDARHARWFAPNSEPSPADAMFYGETVTSK